MVDCPSVNNAVTTNYCYNSTGCSNSFATKKFSSKFASLFMYNNKINIKKDGAEISYMNANINGNGSQNGPGSKFIYFA